MAAFDFGTETLSVVTLVAGVLAAVVLAVVVVAWRRDGGTLFTRLRRSARAGRRARRSCFEHQARAWFGRTAGLRAARRRTCRPRYYSQFPLACLNARAGPTVESACEARIFGRPETIAAAVSYTAAKVALVSDGAALAGGDAEQARAAVAALQRELEADRFGIVAHVLAVNFRLHADRCAAFALVADAGRIRSNLRERAFDRLVARHAGDGRRASRSRRQRTAPLRGAASRAPGRRWSPSRCRRGRTFPSAASIPPVSIMTPEPPRPPEPAAARRRRTGGPTLRAAQAGGGAAAAASCAAVLDRARFDRAPAPCLPPPPQRARPELKADARTMTLHLLKLCVGATA